MYDLDVKEALNRLPREIVDARNQRLKRAMDLSMKHEYLPEDLQVLIYDGIWIQIFGFRPFSYLILYRWRNKLAEIMFYARVFGVLDIMCELKFEFSFLVVLVLVTWYVWKWS